MDGHRPLLPFRHLPLYGEKAGAVLAVVTYSTPETGVVPRRGEGVDSSPHRGGDAQRAEGVFYMQLAVPNVVAIAVRMVITMLRIFPQRVLLLKVPIVFKIKG